MDSEERSLVVLGVVGIIIISVTALIVGYPGKVVQEAPHDTSGPESAAGDFDPVPGATTDTVNIHSGDYAYLDDGLCGNGVLDNGEFCDDGNTASLDGCSSTCKEETDRTIYVAPYVGNIDGEFSEEWYYIFDKLSDFHTNNAIPAGFSIYPSSIHTGEFGESFARMYYSPYVEFVQKGNEGDNTDEVYMYNMTFSEVRAIMLAGRENFTEMASEILGIPESEVAYPVAYNQPQGKFSEAMRDALEDLGFKIFYEMYKADELPAVKSSERLDVLQYGVSFTNNGEAGRDTVFSSSEEIVDEIKSFRREDVNILTIDGRKIVPVWVHQMDFENGTVDNAIDLVKWGIYTETMLSLKGDPDIILVGPSGIYDLRHPQTAEELSLNI